MTEVTQTNTSCFLIALDPKEGQQGITNLTQEAPMLKQPLQKSKSAGLGYAVERSHSEDEE